MFRSQEKFLPVIFNKLSNIKQLFYVRYIRNGFRTMPTSKFDFFVMIVKDMQYFYID